MPSEGREGLISLRHLDCVADLLPHDGDSNDDSESSSERPSQSTETLTGHADTPKQHTPDTLSTRGASTVQLAANAMGVRDLASRRATPTTAESRSKESPYRRLSKSKVRLKRRR